MSREQISARYITTAMKIYISRYREEYTLNTGDFIPVDDRMVYVEVWHGYGCTKTDDPEFCRNHVFDRPELKDIPHPTKDQLLAISMEDIHKYEYAFRKLEKLILDQRNVPVIGKFDESLLKEIYHNPLVYKCEGEVKIA